MNGLPPVLPEIAGPLADFQHARDELEAAIREAHQTCPHDMVLEAPYQSLSYLAPLAPLRMCAGCRLEEEGSHWSGGDNWRARGRGDTVLGNDPDRLVVAAQREQIYALRLPGQRYLANKEDKS